MRGVARELLAGMMTKQTHLMCVLRRSSPHRPPLRSEPLQVVDYGLTPPDVTPPPEADRAEFATSYRAFVEEDRSGSDRRGSGRCEEPNESDWEEDEETEQESVRRYPS